MAHAGSTASLAHHRDFEPALRDGSRHARLPATDPLFHRILLAGSCAVLIVAAVLRVDAGERVVIPLIDQPLPGVCTYKRLLGIACPGCGLTRCFISLCHGDTPAAWQFNPAGLLLFGLVVAQIPYRGYQLWRIRQGAAEWRSPLVSQTAFWSCFAALVTQWLWRTIL